MAKSSALPLPAPRTDVRGRRKTDTTRINDIDLREWKKYTEILTDSLWIFPDRDKSGTHLGDYHGNFVPQIPHQTMLRYTKLGDVVIDAFAGSGTTLIEGKRLGRHVLGVELNHTVAAIARKRVQQEENSHGVSCQLLVGDSRSPRVRLKLLNHLHRLGRKQAQLVVVHPPYYDIIHFSDLREDLCNAPCLSDFLQMFSQVVMNVNELLEPDRFLVLVIGDKYAEGEWVPLGFHTMQEVLKEGFTLKSLIVKNMTGNRAKRNLEHLWRFRALHGGFYIFKHEYIMIFQKRK